MRKHQRSDGGDGPHETGDHRRPHRAEGPLRKRYHKIIYGNLTLVGVLSLVWLILRSGRKPSRLNYPCQKAALANATLLLGATTFPLAARLPRWVARERVERPWVKRLVKAVEFAGVAVLVVLVGFSIAGLIGPPGGRSMTAMQAATATLRAPELRSGSGSASNVYVAQGIPPASEHGVDTLINVMDGNGLDFFKSDRTGQAVGPGGIIGSNDIVLIKVNGEWQDRGGTNTDVVKGLINAIVHHPDGFTGEVVIVENGQWASFMDNLSNNQNPDRCNAEDHRQSFNDVANMFAAAGHRVSVYDWTPIQNNSVEEFGSGDMRDGYCYVPEIEEGYPKFTTVYGTRISLRYGAWNGSGYDNNRVKFLNVPVLKDHGAVGVTGCVKHFMGVQDLWKGTQNAPHTPMVTEGIFGKVMLTARFPDLNIMDAIWVTPANGPNGPYDKAVRVDKLLASKDPVGLDCYAARNILLPISGNSLQNPDANNQFRQMMTTTRDVLVAGGKQATMDEGQMNVYTGWSSEPPPVTPYEYFLAEGCTAYGFETWVLVANPNDQPATVYLSYMTDTGGRNKAPVQVPARSRMTFNASSDIWAQSAGIRVGSDRPVYVERAMYWNDRIEGHDAIGTDAGATDWYIADGHTADGFETWIEILNPAASSATAQVTYMTPTGMVGGPSVVVPAYSRKTLFAADTVSGSDVSTRVTADKPVVVERSMYWDNRRGGTNSPGVKAPSPDWYFAEGCTGWGFETYLCFLNTQGTDAHVSLDFMSASPTGGTATRNIVVPAGTRRTLKVSDVFDNQDVSTKVHSDVPIVAERSMLWAVPGGRAGHATVGMTAPATQVFMPEGCTAYGFDTWLLVQNPGSKDAGVSVYAMTGGGEHKLCDQSVAAGTRKTVKLNDYYQGNLSIRVVANEPVVCERSMYWNNRGGGTSSIGY